MFLRLRAEDAAPREIAWDEFHARYAPVIGGFARNLGALGQDIDDIVQDVMVGFFGRAPSFVYDPAKGRFRGYLKVCTIHAIRSRAASVDRRRAVALENVDPNDVALEQSWGEVWEGEQLERALADVRASLGVGSHTFRAFRMNVVLGWPPEDVARRLNMSAADVLAARGRVTQLLQAKLEELRHAEG